MKASAWGPSSCSAAETTLSWAERVETFTGNWYAAFSGDGGASFAFINPFNGPFPPATGGFCCDQVTASSPHENAIFFLQQYIGDASTGLQRINVDQGADGTFDCFYNVSAQIMGSRPTPS